MNSLWSRASGSVAGRVSLIGGASLLLVLLGICGVMSVLLTQDMRERHVAWVGDKTAAVADAFDASDLTARVLVDKFFTTFQREYSAGFWLKPGGELAHGTEPVAGDFGAVDRFAANTGGVATVFGREGDEFKRLTTSLKNEKGERALGTLLAKGHPARALLLAGQPYTGTAVLFGKPYLTRYEPIKTDNNQVIGILFIGFDTSAFQESMKALVEGTKLFDTGGVYVIDPKKSWAEAVVVKHPHSAGKKLSEVAPQSEAFYNALAAAGPSVAVPSPGLLDAAHTDAWAVRGVSKGTGLWVVGEVSDREAMAKHWATLIPFWLLLGGATVLLATGLYLMMQRWVARPLRSLQHAVGALAEGDLTQSFRSLQRDEIGDVIRAVEAMRQRLLATMSAVRHSVDSISQASAEIALGNTDLSNRTEQTASSLQQTASSMDQLSGNVAQSADSARSADTLAGSAWTVAAKGGQVVSQVVTTMEDINASSKKISDIIGVIDGIAFQTNILALNAAVEAARAGEQGRGFAVVASEVRSLAQRSANAAKEIKGLIGASVEKVDSGTKLVADAGETMKEILASVQRVSQIIGEITSTAASQSAEIGQVSEAVGQLDQMTQQNAALVEQSAAAAESLKEQASKLSQVLREFKLDGAAVAA